MSVEKNVPRNFEVEAMIKRCRRAKLRDRRLRRPKDAKRSWKKDQEI
jgi:hypothetical protein